MSLLAGYPDSANQLLKKCGKILDPILPDDAVDLYKKAAETVLTEDRPRQAADCWTRIARIQVWYFFTGKSVVLHFCEGPEFWMHH